MSMHEFEEIMKSVECPYVVIPDGDKALLVTDDRCLKIFEQLGLEYHLDGPNGEVMYMGQSFPFCLVTIVSDLLKEMRAEDALGLHMVDERLNTTTIEYPAERSPCNFSELSPGTWFIALPRYLGLKVSDKDVDNAVSPDGVLRTYRPKTKVYAVDVNIQVTYRE